MWKCPYIERENTKEKTHEHKRKRGEEHIAQNERKIPSEERKGKHTCIEQKGNVHRSVMENTNAHTVIEKDNERWYPPPNTSPATR